MLEAVAGREGSSPSRTRYSADTPVSFNDHIFRWQNVLLQRTEWRLRSPASVVLEVRTRRLMRVLCFPRNAWGQNGEAIKFGTPEDSKALVMGLTLHQKGQASMRKVVDLL